MRHNDRLVNDIVIVVIIVVVVILVGGSICFSLGSRRFNEIKHAKTNINTPIKESVALFPWTFIIHLSKLSPLVLFTTR